MKYLIIVLLFLTGCGGTSIHYKSDKEEIHYWSMKEYGYFKVKYGEIEMEAFDVGAFKGQSLIKDAFVEGIKAIKPGGM